MKMPAAEPAILQQREALLAELAEFLPRGRLIADKPSLQAYDCDALTAYRQLPMLVVLPDTTTEVARILEICHRRNIKVVARGAGTSVSGGALPLEDCVLMATACAGPSARARSLKETPPNTMAIGYASTVTMTPSVHIIRMY